METDWPSFWRRIDHGLKRRGYAHSTRRFYRQVLRLFARHAGCPPHEVGRDVVAAYLRTLRAPRCSPHWTAMNLAVLRTVFDRLCGLDLVQDRPGPRIPRTLPEILGEKEIARMLQAAGSLRDRVILGLLFGAGLKIGELQNLLWRDVDATERTLTVRKRSGARTLPLPTSLVPLLREGVRRCPADHFVLAGARAGRPLSARWIQILVRRCAEAADILKPVTAMTLRHSYAVQSLEAGSNVRELQECLGHRCLQSTMRYLGFLVPATSPLDMPGHEPPPLRPTLPPACVAAETPDALDPGSLAAMAQTTCQFLSTLRMQLGGRLLSPRGRIGSTGPP